MYPSTVLPPNSSLASRLVSIIQDLRTLYFVRATFSLVWAVLLDAQIPALVPLLLLVYPTWDVAATFGDLRATRRISRRSSLGATGPRYLNIFIGLAATVAVAVALQQDTPSVLIVFGAWAVLTGLIQLFLSWRRRHAISSQWPIMLSGGQSVVAGSTFIALAHTSPLGIKSLVGYAIFGGFYFLLSAWRLRPEGADNSLKAVY